MKRLVSLLLAIATAFMMFAAAPAVNGAAYFQLSSGVDYGKPAISESDKAVMTANGYAGVCVNGKYIDWP